MRTVMCALLLLPAAAFAASAFDGTWKTRMDSMKVTGTPDTFQIAEGTYTCASCTPVIRVRADGVPHAVSGHPYYDSVAVLVVSPTQVEIVDRQLGREVYAMSYVVSADGATLSARLTDRSAAHASAVAFTARRVAACPSGAHAVSGSWQPDQLSDADDALRTISYQMTDADFSMQWNGQSYRAKFDGSEYPVSGDPEHTTVSLRKVDDHTLEETDRRAGQVTDEIRLAAAADGRSIVITDKDLQHGQTTVMTLERQ
ncbi:MAG TPA: hypothetical protein VK695_04365 [Steroidobacteraceae bacterium]|jgi:hypothetical protein|nr:hypothetical protein [Steroidobacteraceae bacterium]